MTGEALKNEAGKGKQRGERGNYSAAMSLREDMEASLTEEVSSASKERRTCTASARKRLIR